MQTARATARIALKSILLATDFSPASKAATPYAMAFARWFDAKITVAHVVPPEPHLAVPMEPVPLQADPLWNIAQRELSGFLPHESAKDMVHEEILRRGELWNVLSDIVRKRAIDLIVIGTHGRQGFRKVILGSAAEKIYRQASCPVLTVGPVAESIASQWRLKQILFPTDFSDCSLHALPYALSLAEENEATLTLLHMIPLIPWQYKEALEETMRKRLASLAPADASCRFEFVVGFDFPVETILDTAKAKQTNLIVMGVSKPAAGLLSSHLPWSVESHIVSSAPCPVFTVRG
jgi:nucleotide-binding universal stress UspA family protein